MLKTLFRVALACALFSVCAPALAAQKTKAQLTTTINTQLPSTGQGAITAAILRQVLQDMVDSDQQILLMNPQTGTSYTFLAGDQGKLVTFNNAAPVAVTLPQATGDFGAGYNLVAQNLGAGVVTITVGGGTINGGVTLTLNQDQVALIVSGGSSAYRAITYGVMVSVTCGTGLSGGVITTTGTCSITDTISSGSAGSATSVPVVTYNSRGQLTTVATATISASTLADVITSARGALLYRGQNGWTGLPPGTLGQVLTTNGPGADPTYTSVAGTGTVTSIAQGAGLSLSSNPITATGTASVDLATNANVWAATASKPVGSDVLNTSMNPVTLTQTTGNIFLSMAAGTDFQVTLTTTPTFPSPINVQPGRTGCMWITQPSTGWFTVSFGANWKFAGATTPTLTTTPGATDVLCYKARTSTFVWGALNKDIR